MNCEEFRARFLAGERDHGAHLPGCRACASLLDDLEADRSALADPTVWEVPSPELEEQVVSLISGSRHDEAASSRPSERRFRLLIAAAVAAVAIGLYALVSSSSPDWEVIMPGTELASGATSTVSGWNTDSGTRMLLEIDGLDPAPEGYVYEFWLSEGPVHVSAGTFRAAGEIELWAGVARAAFPRLWVTLEPLNDDESPSEQTVLDTGA